MDKQASEMLGEAVEVGVQMDSPTAVKAAVGGGIAGALAGRALAGVDVKEASLPAENEAIFYVAVSASKIAFFSVKRGLFKNSLKEKLTEFAHDELKALEIEKGMMAKVHFVFQDGTYYVLMCPKAFAKKLNKAKEILMG